MDPGIQKVLDGMNALEGPPAHEVPVDQARAGHEQETELLGGPGEEVGNVEDVELAGVPVRLYTPLEPAGGAISYFHGGGWVVGSIDSFDTACRASPTRPARRWPASATGWRPSTRSPRRWRTAPR